MRQSKWSAMLNKAMLAGISSVPLLTGCMEWDDTLDLTTTQNVSLVELSDPQLSPYQPGQPISIPFTVSSYGLSDEHVGVAFMAIPADKVGQLETHEDPEGYLLGNHYIEKLEDGELSRTAHLMLPNTDMVSGSYVIAAYVDSMQVIKDELTLDDNRSRGYQVGDFRTYAKMEVVSERYHDFAIDKLVVGDGFVLFPMLDERDSTYGINPNHKRADIIGHFDASKFGTDVNRAEVSATVIIDGEGYPAHFWQETGKHYAERMVIEFADHEQSHYFPFDIAVNGYLLDKIQQAYDSNVTENVLEIELTLHDQSAHNELDLDNNSMKVRVPYSLYQVETPEKWKQPGTSQAEARYLPEQPRVMDRTFVSYSKGIIARESYDALYGDKSKVAVNARFYASSLLTSEGGGLAEIKTQGDFDLYMFNNHIRLFEVAAEGLVTAENATVTYGVAAYLLENQLFFEYEEVQALNESYPYDWTEEQKLFSTTFTIVIVPITVSAGVKGEVGLNADLVFEDFQFSVGGDVLSAGLSAYATAGVDLLIASGGIGVDFLIIGDTLNATAYTGFANFLDRGEIDWGIDVSNHMKAIEGEFYLWVKYPSYKFCCSFPTKTATKTIYNTGALYDKTWSLLNYNGTFQTSN